MSAKQIIFDESARQKIINGVSIVSKAVTTTLGPKGRNVAIDKVWGPPAVIHDGASVAKEIELEDKFENMGAQLIKEAASKTNEETGDGTTTATLLTEQIVLNGMRHIVAGANPMGMERGIKKAVDAVVKEINRISKDVTEKDWEKVATLSAQNEEIGKKIAEAYRMVGKDGIVEVESGRSTKIEIEHSEGMEFDRGYISPYFVTDKEKMVVELIEPVIFITDYKLVSRADILPIIELFMKNGMKNFVVIADDVSGDALQTLVVNSLRGVFNCVALKAPGYGDRRKAILEDLGILTGADPIFRDAGDKLDQVNIDCLGRASLVKTTRQTTTLVGLGNKEEIKSRIKLIDQEISATNSDFDKEKLEERKAKLSSGIASIKVGAATESEANNLKERVKDAKEAMRSALNSGIIPGGGVALLKARRVLDKVKCSSEDELAGVKLIKSVLELPIRKLIENSGEDAGWIVKRIEEDANDNFGFNVMTGEFVDLVVDGVIEPALVATSSLRNASSAAAMILTTECLITEVEEKSKSTEI